jgi:tRNA C32,U32 (ribose-2'-O)-methylase TrmJ
MYLDIFKERMENFMKNQEDSKELKQLQAFKQNLIAGIDYYQTLFAEKKKEVVDELERMLNRYPVLQTEL